MTTTDPATVTVTAVRTVDESTATHSRAAALAWAAATAERYPGADVSMRIRREDWRDHVTSGVRWVADLHATWPPETYTEPGPQPRDLEDLRTELEYIDQERSA